MLIDHMMLHLMIQFIYTFLDSSLQWYLEELNIKGEFSGLLSATWGTNFKIICTYVKK